MARTIIEKFECDRPQCGKEFKIRDSSWEGVETIDNLQYMVKRNGSGSMNSDMSKMLCPDCTKEFLKFMGADYDY